MLEGVFNLSLTPRLAQSDALLLRLESTDRAVAPTDRSQRTLIAGFVHDTLFDETVFWAFTIVDDFSWEYPAIEAGRSIPDPQAVRVLGAARANIRPASGDCGGQLTTAQSSQAGRSTNGRIAARCGCTSSSPRSRCKTASCEGGLTAARGKYSLRTCCSQPLQSI